MTEAHATLTKFGYPATVIAEFAHWAVLLRPQQVTLASLVLVNRGAETNLGALPVEAFTEMHRVVQLLEAGLRRFRPFDRINYLALMMVDPHVHFHVLPRYGSDQLFEGITFTDAGWPGAPDLKKSNDCPGEVMASLRRTLMDAFGKAR